VEVEVEVEAGMGRPRNGTANAGGRTRAKRARRGEASVASERSLAGRPTGRGRSSSSSSSSLSLSLELLLGRPRLAPRAASLFLANKLVCGPEKLSWPSECVIDQCWPPKGARRWPSTAPIGQVRLLRAAQCSTCARRAPFAAALGAAATTSSAGGKKRRQLLPPTYRQIYYLAADQLASDLVCADRIQAEPSRAEPIQSNPIQLEPSVSSFAPSTLLGLQLRKIDARRACPAQSRWPPPTLWRRRQFGRSGVASNLVVKLDIQAAAVAAVAAATPGCARA